MTKRTSPWLRFMRDRRGSAMIEFGMLGPLFLMTTLAVFDVSWMFTRNMALDSATRAVARDIRTGEIYLSGVSDTDREAAFRQRLCQEMILVNCGEVLVSLENAGLDFANVTPPTDFTTESFEESLNPGGSDPESRMGIVAFTAGNPSSVMTVRTGVEHKFMTPFLHQLWGDDDGRLQFMVTEIFRNEPFPTQPST